MLDYEKSNLIHKIGFVKKGMSETLRKIRSTNCSHLLLKTDIEKIITNKNELNEIKIGVYTHDEYRKNIHNQIAAALMIDDAKIYIKKDYNFDYLDSKNRFCVKPFDESIENFYSHMSMMTLNLYVTFSECWGQVITESLLLGVPCLASNNSGIFDYNDFLKENLIVDEYDDSNSIYKKIIQVIEKRESISREGIKYIHELNKIADEKLNLFLND